MTNTVDFSKLESLTVCRGQGNVADGTLCVMQAVDWLTTGKTSDAPECVSPVISAFMRRWNDALRTDADRKRLLIPLVPAMIGTRTTQADDHRRSYLAIDWSVRVSTPMWLRLAKLDTHALALEVLPELDNHGAVRAARSTIHAARKAAAAGAAVDADTAADAAAGATLAPTMLALQASAQTLVRRMCAVGRKAPAVLVTNVAPQATP